MDTCAKQHPFAPEGFALAYRQHTHSVTYPFESSRRDSEYLPMRVFSSRSTTTSRSTRSRDSKELDSSSDSVMTDLERRRLGRARTLSISLAGRF